MSFDIPAAAYDRFMGRYSAALAPLFADFADVAGSQRVLDVGCGPGSLTAVLLERGAVVTAVDPSPSFVEAARERYPEAEVQLGSAESLPFSEDAFDRVVAQLVVHHMADPVAGIREMSRVATADGVVAACVWDHAGGRSPLGVFWEAYRRFDPAAPGESLLPGTREGQLVELFEEAGLREVAGEELSFEYPNDGFEDWWGPFSRSAGPVGRILGGLDGEQRRELEELCRQVFPADGEPFRFIAWAARGAPTQTM